MKHKKRLAFLFAVIWPVLAYPQAQGHWFRTIRAASGDRTEGETTVGVYTEGYAGRFFTEATLTIDITKLTLPDADDEVDFYIQTTYDNGENWVDTENIHFDDDDDSSTTRRIVYIDGSVDGPGVITDYEGPDTAAGVESSAAVPENALWRFQSGFVELVAAVGGGARHVHVIISHDGTDAFYRGFSPSTQVANSTAQYSVGPHGADSVAVSGEHWIPFPIGLVIHAGDTISTETDEFQAGDNYSAPFWSVEEWHDPKVLTDGTIRNDIKSYSRPLGSMIRIKTTVAGATAPTYAYNVTAFLRRP